MNAPSLALAGGGQIPAVGLGLWKVPRPATADLVRRAIRTGYRHLDCACDYGNEAGVRAGIPAALAARVRPAVLQVELHPYLAQEKFVRFARESGIAVTAFSPLAAQSYHSIGMAEAGESVLNEQAVRTAAARHGKTPAQVVLRWGVQRG